MIIQILDISYSFFLYNHMSQEQNHGFALGGSSPPEVARWGSASQMGWTIG